MSCFPQSQVLPQRIPIAEIGLGEQLVDHRNGRRAGPVAFREITAGQDRNLHGCEERRSDGQEPVGRIGWRAGYADGQSMLSLDERIPFETRAAHARDRAEVFP